MSKQKIQAEILKGFRAIAATLPQVNERAYATDWLTGWQILDLYKAGKLPKDYPIGRLEHDKKYPMKRQTEVPFNHFRRMKQSYLKGGQEAVEKYLKDLKSFVASNQPVAKPVEA